MIMLTMNPASVAAHPPLFIDRAIGDIAAEMPQAVPVFLKAGLDFCCGGALSLRDAAQALGADPVALERDILAANGDVAGSQLPAADQIISSDLIDHILTRYHDVHRQELPGLIDLARKVEAVHQGHALAPIGVVNALQDLKAELEAHMAKEELILFPLMRQGGHAMIGHPIARMRVEHDAHGERLRHLRQVTHDLVLPVDACTSWRNLYAGIGKLVDDLMQHIHLENNLLFPRFATDLPAAPTCIAG
jgi:regulator of cell morphogenesis and NO signaling